MSASHYTNAEQQDYLNKAEQLGQLLVSKAADYWNTRTRAGKAALQEYLDTKAKQRDHLYTKTEQL